MNIVPPITNTPTYALLDKDLGDSDYRLLSLVAMTSGIGGSGFTNSSLAGMIGWTVARVRKDIEDLVARGYMVEEERDKRYLVVCGERSKAAVIETPKGARTEVFDPSNKFVDESDITHVISMFVSNKINKSICTDAAVKRLYQNPWARAGAKKLVQDHGMPKVEEVLAKLGSKVREMYCPKPKSPWALYQNWKRITEYLDDTKEKAIVRI